MRNSRSLGGVCANVGLIKAAVIKTELVRSEPVPASHASAQIKNTPERRTMLIPNDWMPGIRMIADSSTDAAASDRDCRRRCRRWPGGAVLGGAFAAGNTVSGPAERNVRF